jgi:hypothetical protein
MKPRRPFPEGCHARKDLLALSIVLVAMPAGIGISCSSPLPNRPMPSDEDRSRIGAMSSDYIEAIVILRDGADTARVRSWFGDCGFGTTSMHAGLLISGSESLFRTTFGVHQDFGQGSSIDTQLPTPTPVQEWVSSIVIRRLPSLHAQQPT